MRTIGLITAALAVTVTIAAVSSRSHRFKEEGAVQTPGAAVHAQVVTLKVPDMFCAGCEIGVKIAANKVEGVKEVKTDSDTRTADVTFDSSKTTAQAIASAITAGTGFKTEVVNSSRKKT